MFFTVPLTDKTGLIVLWDMYLDGEWHGSRRTINQVNEYRRQVGGQYAVAA